MDKNYTIVALERKTTSTGKAVINCSLKDETGAVTERVSIWSDFLNFASLANGSQVYGKLYTNEKGYITLYPPRANGSAVGGGNHASTGNIQRSGGGVAKNMDRKEASIDKFQGKKEESVKTAGTMRDAVLLATSQGIEGLSDEETQNKVLKWRKFVWDNYEHKEEKTDEEKIRDGEIPF